jgi:ABC-type multidrug transport system ATPase subunit
MTMGAIVVDHVTKTYKNGKDIQVGVSDVSFSVEKGEIFGLIGPDGAGKTSLIHVLTTLLLADSGVATVDGYDVIKDYKQIRNTIGYMPGKFSLYQDLSIEENLDFFATAFKTTVTENYDLIKDIYVQIEPFKKRRAGKLSGGMKQKLALCCALIHRPSVLILDEPTTGVDVISRKEFWDMLKRLKTLGITVLVSTPYMDEANLCNRIALMQNGKILVIDTPDQIIQSYKNILWSVKSSDMYQSLLDLRTYERTVSCYSFGVEHHLTISDPSTTREDIVDFLQKKGHTKVEVQRITANIEDCFMELMTTKTTANPSSNV